MRGFIRFLCKYREKNRGNYPNHEAGYRIGSEKQGFEDSLFGLGGNGKEERKILVGIERAESRSLAEKEGKREEKDEDEQENEEHAASRNVIKRADIGLSEEPENVIEEMCHDSGGHRPANICSEAEEKSREEIYGDAGWLKMHRGKENRGAPLR